MSFEELGSVLRAEREKRGLTLDNVAEHLKISARILRALEEGDDSALPHTVYVRGFVRSYGNYLGLDSEELHEAMTSLNDEEQDVQPANVYVTQEMDSHRGGGKIFFAVVVVLLCAAAAAFFWFYRDADLFSDLQQARLSTAQPAPPLNARPEAAPSASASGTQKGTPAQPKSGTTPKEAAPSIPVAKTAPAAVAEQAPAATQGNAAAQQAALQAQQNLQAQRGQQAQQNAQGTGQVGGQSGGQTTAGQNPAAQAAAAQADSAQTVRESAPVSGHHKIIITALAECWIHSNADGADTRQFSLRKGDTFALTFADKLMLKLGNAGGVRIRYNGEDLPPQGKDGQVRTLTFPLSTQ